MGDNRTFHVSLGVGGSSSFFKIDPLQELAKQPKQAKLKALVVLHFYTLLIMAAATTEPPVNEMDDLAAEAASRFGRIFLRHAARTETELVIIGA
jgi:hypothetical protein